MGVLATIIELGSDSTLYGILLFLHIICAILGFGSLALNGLYGQQAAERKGPEGVAIGQANMAVSKVAEVFVYGVFVFGILLVLTAEDDLIGFERPLGVAVDPAVSSSPSGSPTPGRSRTPAR